MKLLTPILTLLLVAAGLYSSRGASPVQAASRERESSALPSAAPQAAPGPRVYWGTYLEKIPEDMTRPLGFEVDARKPVSIVHWAAPWMNSSGGFVPFRSGVFDRIRLHGSIPMFTWGSHRLGRGSTQHNFQNRDIYNGKYDSFIRQWATDAKNWGHPFFLRYDWEMNGWWFAWSEGKLSDGTIVNNNRAGDFVKMWRHVHDIFTQVGATNVTWVWCPNVMGKTKRYPALSSLYPGDSYVDWTCLDGYNTNSPWLSLYQVLTGTGVTYLRNSYQAVLNIAPHKPMMIGETGSLEAGDGGAKKGQWFKSVLGSELPNNLPRVKAFVYYNSDANDPANTFPIESSALSQEGFAEGISSSYYAPNLYGTLDTAPIPPLP